MTFLRIRRHPNQLADIVSVRSHGEAFIAVVRDEQQRETSATGTDQFLGSCRRP
jgi:hypothetical protein